MPDIQIVKLKLRRGTNAQRSLITLDQGEMGYTTDTKRVFVGDGSTTGGVIIGTRIFSPIASNKIGLAAHTGDVVCEGNLMYQLTGTDSTQTSAWALISPIVDNSTIQHSPTTNALRIKPSGVGITELGSIVYSQGGIILNSQGLSANVDNNTLKINGSNQLAISAVYASSIIGQINNTQIDTTTVAGSALQGTANGTLNVLIDNATLTINNSNQLAVSALDTSKVVSGTFGFNRLSPTAFGQGLQGGGSSAVTTNIDTDALQYSSSSAITLKTLQNAARISLSANNATFRGFSTLYRTASATATYESTSGTIVTINISDVGVGYSIVPTVSVQPPPNSAGYFAASAVVTLYNGALSAITITNPGSGYNYNPQVVISAPTHTETTYQVTTATSTGGISTNARTFELSSAGFAMIHMGNGIGMMAVPIFRVPDELQSLTISTVTV